MLSHVITQRTRRERLEQTSGPVVLVKRAGLVSELPSSITVCHVWLNEQRLSSVCPINQRFGRRSIPGLVVYHESFSQLTVMSSLLPLVGCRVARQLSRLLHQDRCNRQRPGLSLQTPGRVASLYVLHVLCVSVSIPSIHFLPRLCVYISLYLTR